MQRNDVTKLLLITSLLVGVGLKRVALAVM